MNSVEISIVRIIRILVLIVAGGEHATQTHADGYQSRSVTQHMNGFLRDLRDGQNTIGQQRRDRTKDEASDHQNWVPVKDVLVHVQPAQVAIIHIGAVCPIGCHDHCSGGEYKRDTTQCLLQWSSFRIQKRRLAHGWLGIGKDSAHLEVVCADESKSTRPIRDNISRRFVGASQVEIFRLQRHPWMYRGLL